MVFLAYIFEFLFFYIKKLNRTPYRLLGITKNDWKNEISKATQDKTRRAKSKNQESFMMPRRIMFIKIEGILVDLSSKMPAR